MRRNATREPISTKFGTVVGIPDKITYTNFCDHRLKSFWVAGVEFTFSHRLSLSPLQHSHCRACDPKIASVWSAKHLPSRGTDHRPEAHAGGFTSDPHYIGLRSRSPYTHNGVNGPTQTFIDISVAHFCRYSMNSRSYILIIKYSR